MNELAISTALDNLNATFTNIRNSGSEDSGVRASGFISNIRDGLNELLKDKNLVCTDVIYTENTDKPYFGIVVNPKMDAQSAIKFFATQEDISFSSYQLELDSRLFNVDLTSAEIVAMLVYEITSTLSQATINEVRALIDLQVLSEEDIISIRDSINYSQLIIYALKDTMYKVSSMLFKDDVEDLLANPVVGEFNISEALLSAQGKLISNVYGINDTVRDANVTILKWVFMIYTDVKGNVASARDTLKDALEFSPSLLWKNEINKTLESIDRIGSQSVVENVSLNKLIESKALYSLNEISIFKSLKMSGLRAIEDEYYELAVQAKAAETEDDAMYVIRGINTRLSVLEDYIYNTDLRDSERKHWSMVAAQYRHLRESLLKNKINKRKYANIFMSYGDFPSDKDED